MGRRPGLYRKKYGSTLESQPPRKSHAQATLDYIMAGCIINAEILALGVTMFRRLPHLLLEFHEPLDASKVGQI
jgi:hypothetical protein